MFGTYRYLALLLFLLPLKLYTQGYKQIDSLRSELKNELTNKQQVDIFIELSRLYVINNIDSSVYFNQLAYELASKSNYRKGIASAHINMGRIAETEGNYQLAIEKFHKALDIFSEENDTTGIIQAKTNLALTHYYLNNPEKSLQYGQDALKDAENSNMDDIGNIYNTVGLAFLATEKYDTALYYFEQSKRLAEEHNIPTGIAYSLGNIANVYLSKNELKKALEIYFEVKKLSVANNNKIGLSLSYVNISGVYLQMGYQSDNDALKKNYFESALTYADSALRTAKETNSLTHISYAYYQLMFSYEGINDYKNAFDNALLYLETNDSLYNLQKMKEIQQIEGNYKIENFIKEQKLNESIIKTQNQIIVFGSIAIFLVVILLIFVFVLYRRMKKVNVLLNEKNRAIENQRAEIAGQRDNLSELAFELKMTNKTKDKFFSILAHDLKNPFQSILGFSELLKTQTETDDYSNIKHYANIIHETGKKTFSLLENLLNWARFQRGMIKYNPEICMLYEIVDETVHLLKENAQSKNIRLEIDIEKNLNVYIDAFLVSTILRNLISNALKFTKRGGLIQIKTKEKENNTVDVLVIDNGIGIKPEKLDKIFKLSGSSSQKGTEDEAGTGLGLLVCKEFAKKNKGDLTVKSQVNVGSTFILNVLKRKPGE
jgi:signal transduction histidine kinase